MKDFWVLLLAICLGHTLVFSQTNDPFNIIDNGSFERRSNNTVPLNTETFQDGIVPSPWEEFNTSIAYTKYGRWFTDSIFNCSQCPVQDFSNGYFRDCFGLQLPWDSTAGTFQDAQDGEMYIGFLHTQLFHPREGLQQFLHCPLNSGHYTIDLWWSRAYSCYDATFKVHLNKSKDNRGKRILKVEHDDLDPAGGWNHAVENFDLEATKKNDMNKEWISIIGKVGGFQDNVVKYFWVDNVRLFRQCDIDNQCSRTSGQICPVVLTPADTMDVLRFENIHNASDYTLKLYSSGGVELNSFYHHNSNGMPNFYIPGSYLRDSLLYSQGTYEYSIRFSNDCGSAVREGKFDLSNFYSHAPFWNDTTDHWTTVPVECCMDTIIIENTQIVGDVRFLANDYLEANNNVSIANGYNVTMQAPGTVVLVDFDSGQSSLTVSNAPCTNKTFPNPGGNPSSGGQSSPPQLSANPVSIKPEFEQFKTELFPNYPNPFKNRTIIRYLIGQPGQVDLSVFDTQMRPVAKLVSDYQEVGKYEIPFDGNKLPPGIYFCKLTTAGFVEAISMVVIQ